MISRKLLLPSAVLLLSVALAGCTGESNSAEPKPQATASDGSSKPVTEVTDQPGSVEGYAGARDDAEVSSCAADGANWVVKGTVKNPTEATQDYRIYVSVLDGEGATLALVQTDVAAVATGKSAEWNVKAEVSGKDLRCVLRVERFETK